MADRDASRDFDITLPGVRRQLVVIRDRYEVASILNDLLIGVWFLIGSILFFNEDTARAGTWLFVLGSAQLMVRPGIRLGRRVHLQRKTGGSQPHDSHDDY